MAEADPAIVHSEAVTTVAADKPNRRKQALTAVIVAFLIAGAIWGAWYVLVGSQYEETDNAYVGADTALVTPMVAGQGGEVLHADTDVVKRGDVLVRLDDSDARIALASAEADLAKARRMFGQASATNTALSAQVAARGADIRAANAQLQAAQSAFAKADVDYRRRQSLAASGAVSGDELTAATNALAGARAALEQARAAVAQATSTQGAAVGNLAANDALIRGTTVDSSPDVLAASARVAAARLDVERMVIRAPIDGVVAGRTVQLGQRVAPGATVMRIVPVAQVYVDANFKESQLASVQPGQPVTLTSDLYGDDVVFHGKVVGVAGGTGSAFALIPAQNATGNWIKVVQRLPVRVALDPKELAAHPLRVGLSMTARVDISGK